MSDIVLPWQCRKRSDMKFLKRDMCDKKRVLSQKQLEENKDYMDKDFCPQCRGPVNVLLKENMTSSEITSINPMSKKVPDRCSVCDVEIGPMTKTGKCRDHSHEKIIKKESKTSWSGAAKESLFNKKTSVSLYGFEIKRLYKTGLFWWIEYIDEEGKVVNKSTGARNNEQKNHYLNQLKKMKDAKHPPETTFVPKNKDARINEASLLEDSPPPGKTDNQESLLKQERMVPVKKEKIYGYINLDIVREDLEAFKGERARVENKITLLEWFLDTYGKNAE